MKNKIVFCLLISFQLNAFYLKGQDSTRAEIPTSTSIQFGFTYGGLVNDNTTLNRNFSKAGLGTFDRSLLYKSFSVKISMNKFFLRRIIFGFERGQYRSFDGGNNALGDMTGASIGINIAYKILDKSKVLLYPYAGINLNETRIRYSSHDTTSIRNIADIVNVTKKEGSIFFPGESLDLGIGGERIFKSRTIGSCPRNVRYFSIGIKAGYLLKLTNKNNAYYDSKLVSDGPSFGLNGAYIALTMHYGIRFRKLKWQ